MTILTVHAAKTNLSKVLARVEAGEEIIIARGDKPVAKLVPINPVVSPPTGTGPRGYGMLKDQLSLPDSFFFDPLPDDELALMESGELP